MEDYILLYSTQEYKWYIGKKIRGISGNVMFVQQMSPYYSRKGMALRFAKKNRMAISCHF